MQKNKRINFKQGKTFSVHNISDKKIIQLLGNFRSFLINQLPKLIKKPSPDLKNIRDEMLADTNQTIYLFSLK